MFFVKGFAQFFWRQWKMGVAALLNISIAVALGFSKPFTQSPFPRRPEGLHRANFGKGRAQHIAEPVADVRELQLFLAPSIFKCWSLPGLGPRNLTLNPIASHSNQSSAQLRVIITLGLILKPCERSKSIFKHMALSDVLLLSNPAPSVHGTTPASLRSTARANASQRELIS